MILTCLECGAKNRVRDLVKPSKRYSCGKCGAALGATTKPAKARRARSADFLDLASRLGETCNSKRFYIPFCLACSAVALALGLLMTHSGPGVSEDSIAYISNAENIHDGNGFYPWFNHYPLYPLLIAGFMHVGLGAERAAALIPVLSFALLMFPIFFLGKVLYSAAAGCLACSMCLVTTAMLALASFALTDMPYVLLSAVAILFLAVFAKTDGAGTRLLCIAAFFTALAICMRFTGVTLLLVGLVAITIKNRGWRGRAILQAALFSLISILPIVPWLYRNAVVTSSLTAGFALRETDHLVALAGSAAGIAVIILGQFFFLFLGLALVAWWPSVSRDRRRASSPNEAGWRAFARDYNVLISYVVISVIVLIVKAPIWVGVSYVEPRFVEALFPFLILLLLFLIFFLWRQVRTPASKPALFMIAMIACVLFMGFQSFFSLVHVSIAAGGQGYNSSSWRSSEGLDWLEKNLPDDAIIYSNNGYAVRYRLKRLCWSLPQQEGDEAMGRLFERLNSEGNSHLICFKGEKWGREGRSAGSLSHGQVTEFNDKYGALTLLADFSGSTIWRSGE